MEARAHATTLPVFGTLADAARFVAAHPVVFVGVVPTAVWLLVATIVAPNEGLFPEPNSDDRSDWGVAVLSTFVQALSAVLTTAIVASIAGGMRWWTDVRTRFVRSASSVVVFEALLAMPGWVLFPLTETDPGAWAALPKLLRGVVVVGTMFVFVASLYAMVRLSFVTPAIVVDGLDLSTAIRQSWAMLRGRLGRIIWLGVIPLQVASVSLLAPNPVSPIVDCFTMAFIQTALVLAYVRLSGATPRERSSSARATSVPAPA